MGVNGRDIHGSRHPEPCTGAETTFDSVRTEYSQRYRRLAGIVTRSGRRAHEAAAWMHFERFNLARTRGDASSLRALLRRYPSWNEPRETLRRLHA